VEVRSLTGSLYQYHNNTTDLPSRYRYYINEGQFRLGASLKVIENTLLVMALIMAGRLRWSLHCQKVIVWPVNDNSFAGSLLNNRMSPNTCRF